jgi:hypothetical protein
MASPVIAAGQQPAVPTEIPVALRSQLKQERLGIVTAVRGLPLGVRDELQRLFGGSLDIADTGAKFRGPGAGDPSLPMRRLSVAGCSVERCLVYYERGGVAPGWRVAIFHWIPAQTRLEWGGVAPPNLRSLDEVRNAVLSGVVKGPVQSW